MVPVVSIRLIARSCLGQRKQRPVSCRIWSANVSSWLVVMPRGVTTGRRSTTEPLATKTKPSNLASWYFVPRPVNCVFSAFSFSLFEDIQRPMSSIHATRRHHVYLWRLQSIIPLYRVTCCPVSLFQARIILVMFHNVFWNSTINFMTYGRRQQTAFTWTSSQLHFGQVDRVTTGQTRLQLLQLLDL